MKFRVIAGTAAAVMLLAATGCGTGNLANNAYRVSRFNNGIVRERDGNITTNRTRLDYNTTGRAMNDINRTTRGTRNIGRRLGNAVNNTRSTVNRSERKGNRAERVVNHNTNRLGNNVNNVANNTGRIYDGVNYNANGQPYDGTPNGVTTARGIDGRVIGEKSTGAYHNPHNFQNTVYRESESRFDGNDNYTRTNSSHTVNRGTESKFDGNNNYNSELYRQDVLGNKQAQAHPSRTAGSNPGSRTLTDNNTQQHNQSYLTSDNSAFDDNVVRDGNVAAKPQPTNSPTKTR